MRILVINSCIYPYPPEGYSGLEYISGLRAEELAKQGYEVYFASPKGTKTKYAKTIETIEATWDVDAEIKAFDVYKNVIDEVDVIIDDSWLKLSLNKYHPNKLYLLVLHNPFSYQHLEGYNFKENIILVAPSKSLADYVSWRFDAKIEVAYHGIDLNFYTPNYKPLNEREYYLFVGRVERMKGVHNFIRLCKDLNLKGKIAARYSNVPDMDYVDKILSMLDNNIEFLGEVSRKELVKLYRNAKATILLHDYVNWLEAFGLVAIESLACGTPVIATRCGAFVEFITPKVGYLSNNYFEIRDFIKKYDKNPDKYISIEECRKVAEAFSKENMVKKYIKIIEKK